MNASSSSQLSTTSTVWQNLLGQVQFIHPVYFQVFKTFWNCCQSCIYCRFYRKHYIIFVLTTWHTSSSSLAKSVKALTMVSAKPLFHFEIHSSTDMVKIVLTQLWIQTNRQYKYKSKHTVHKTTIAFTNIANWHTLLKKSYKLHNNMPRQFKYKCSHKLYTLHTTITYLIHLQLPENL